MQTAALANMVTRPPARVVRRGRPILARAARDRSPRRRAVHGAFLGDRQPVLGREQSGQAVGLGRTLEALADEEPTWEDAEWL